MTIELNTKIPAADGRDMSAAWLQAESDSRGTIVLFMDGFGPRAALMSIASRLVQWGYDVLVPNLYYREANVLPVNVAEVFNQGEYAQQFFSRLEGMNEAIVLEDVTAVANYLQAAERVNGKLATVGYCLGGRYALSFAGVMPDCSFAASVHGANLATESPHSAHRLAAKGQADVYLSVAQIDPTFSMGELDTVRDVLMEAGRHLVTEIHPGAVHGFSLPDLPVYDQLAADAHWDGLARFLK